MKINKKDINNSFEKNFRFRKVHLAICAIFLIVILACRTTRMGWTPKPFPQPEIPITAETIDQVRELARLPQPGTVEAMAWSPDGSILAVYTETFHEGWQGKIQLWDASTGEPYDTIEMTGIYQLAFSPNGEMLAGIGFSGLYVWQISDGTLIIEMPENQHGEKQIAFYSDGSPLALRHNTTIQLLEMPSGNLLSTIPLKRQDSRFAFFTNEPKMLIAEINNTKIFTLSIWDIFTGEEIDSAQFPIKGPIIFHLSILLPDKMLAVMPIDSITLGIFDLQTGDLILEWDGFRFHVPSFFTFSPDGSVLVAGEGICFEVRGRRGLRLLDVINYREVSPHLHGHTCEIRKLAFSPDGRFLASAAEDNMIFLWGVPPGNKD